MRTIDPKEFETRIRVRRTKITDFDELLEMQKACFGAMPNWGRDQIESQIQHFPEGQLVVEYEKEVVASASALIVDFDRYADWQNWQEVADNGYIRNHIPDGDTLYGIEIMVHPDCRGMRLSRRLYDARKQICRDRNLARIIIAGRIPGYGAHAEEITAREYVEKVIRKELYDPVLTAQTANGFVLKGLIPNYLPGDQESRGYATFLEWVNLDYRAPRTRRYRAVSIARLAVVQYQLRPIDSFEEYEKQCAFFVDTAAEYKSDFVVFPELICTQLLSYMQSSRPGLEARLLAEQAPRMIDMFRDLAIQNNINIIGGSHFEIDEGKLYNVAYLFRRNGTLERQAKLHITPSERKWWGIEAGDHLKVFETDCGRVAILICYDIEFPELARVAAGKGADIIFVPFNTDVRSAYLRVRTCAQARAIENEIYVAVSGCVGNLPFVDNADIHYAQSSIFTPSDIMFERDGIAAECTPNIETMVISDMDIEALRRARYSGSVQNWKDRRTDLYNIVWREDGEETSI